MRRALQDLAFQGAFVAIWSPWIIAELNRVLTWRWIRGYTKGDLSHANEQRCAAAAKAMMDLLMSTFELVNPQPPYSRAWPELRDPWDYPIWATAVDGKAQYVISENVHDYPPRQPDGRHVYQGIEYLSSADFIGRLTGD